MKIRRAIILVLILAFFGVNAYRFMGIQEVSRVMDSANLMIHEAIDQKASMEHPNFIKEPYVSAIPEGVNIALDGKVDASSFTDSFTPRKVNDGKTSGVSYWEGKADTFPNVLTIDLKKTATIHAIRICLNPMNVWGKRTQTFSVNKSGDGVNFEALIPIVQYTFDPDRGNEVMITFDPVEAQYVQLEFTENSGAGGAQVAEFEIYSSLF